MSTPGSWWSGAFTAGALIAGTLAAASAYAQDVPALADATDDAERARIQQLIDGARAEGSFEWIGGFVTAEQGPKILDAFKEYYGLTDLDAQYTQSSTGELITRVNQLLNAKSNNFDVMWTSSWAWYKDLLKAGELMEYRSPNYAAYTLSNEAGMSVDGYWVCDGYANSPMYNPAALEKLGITDFTGESWNDLVDPRLKGLVSIPDPLTSASGAQTFIGIAKVMGDDWIAKLVQNEPVRRAQAAQATGWLTTGEIPVTISHAREAAKLQAKNVPVGLAYPREGIVLNPFAPVILASAPHPNAAKLFIDYVRSAKGAQTVMDVGAFMFFGRPGVKSPVPDLLPSWEEVTVVKMDFDNDFSNDQIAAVREEFRKAGMQ
jgi:iron(III) transport system substrate-binding protein